MSPTQFANHASLNLKLNTPAVSLAHFLVRLFGMLGSAESTTQAKRKIEKDGDRQTIGDLDSVQLWEGGKREVSVKAWLHGNHHGHSYRSRAGIADCYAIRRSKIPRRKAKAWHRGLLGEELPRDDVGFKAASLQRNGADKLGLDQESQKVLRLGLCPFLALAPK